jgi:hypothetical protein
MVKDLTEKYGRPVMLQANWWGNKFCKTGINSNTWQPTRINYPVS